MFHVGQMIVCVDDKRSNRKLWRGEKLPTKGCIYTIREIIHDGLLLEEIVNAPHQYADAFGEMRFDPTRFRPVRQTSIEQFTSILNQAPQREDA